MESVYKIGKELIFIIVFILLNKTYRALYSQINVL